MKKFLHSMFGEIPERTFWPILALGYAGTHAPTAERLRKLITGSQTSPVR
jgi:hypothetical protein